LKWQSQPIGDLRWYAHANEAPRLSHEERDHFSGNFLRCENEISLVLSLGAIDYDNRFSGTNIGKNIAKIVELERSSSGSFTSHGRDSGWLYFLEMRGFRSGSQALESVYKLTDVGKFAIHGGEPHVRNLVHLTKLLDDRLPDHPTINLSNTHLLKLTLDSFNCRVDSFSANRSLLASSTKATPNLLALKNLTTPVFFDNSGKRQLDTLVRGKAIPTILALSTTPNRSAVATRVSYRAFV
jgi:hypothetical protein